MPAGRFDGVVSLSLQFLAPVGARPGEVRLAKWQEFGFVQARWTIPAERMKMRKEHIVPLSRQALGILETMRGLTGKRSFVFSLSRDEPMSDNTLNKALRIMDYDTKTQHCAHGFRSSFSTILNDEYPTIRHSSTSGRLSLLRNNAPLTRKGHIVSIASSR